MDTDPEGETVTLQTNDGAFTTIPFTSKGTDPIKLFLITITWVLDEFAPSVYAYKFSILYSVAQAIKKQRNHYYPWKIKNS